ncbi:hypothetical protein D3C81_1211190 [compost metagenome]
MLAQIQLGLKVIRHGFIHDFLRLEQERRAQRPQDDLVHCQWLAVEDCGLIHGKGLLQIGIRTTVPSEADFGKSIPIDGFGI